MNKLIKFTLFNSIEVSLKFSQLFFFQRMSTANVNNAACTEQSENASSTNVQKRESDVKEYVEQTTNETSILYNIHNINPQIAPFPVFDINKTLLPLLYLNTYGQHNNVSLYNNISYTFPGIPTNFYEQSYRNYHWKKENKLGQKMLSLRSWENVTNHPGSKVGFVFTLMSYNVLAQDLMNQHPELYKYHDSESLVWDRRWDNLLKEITRLQPDILCLQEVQESHLTDYYSTLGTMGYQVVFKKRTGQQPDGCAIYYKTENIKMIDCNVVEYFQPLVKLLNRDNVGIVVKFAPRQNPSREFVVATTHLLYNPKRNDVRMAQMQLLLTEIEKMSYKNDEKKPYYLPVILTGDFNSPPHSDLYDFVTKAKINYEKLSSNMLSKSANSCDKQVLVTSSLGITDNCQHKDLLHKRKTKNMKPEKEPTEPQTTETQCEKESLDACKDKKMLTHSFKFKSVYTHGTEEMNEATTYQNEWLTVDYIFYSKKKRKKRKGSKLKLLARYKLPTSQELEGITIPNNVYGSDHLSLVAKFKLKF